MDQLETLADRVTYIFEHSEFTPAGVAAKIHCSREAIQQWMSGATANIKNDLLFAFADLTGYEARWIATGEGPRCSAYRSDPRSRVVLAVMERMSAYDIDAWIKIGDTLNERAPATPEPVRETG